MGFGRKRIIVKKKVVAKKMAKVEKVKVKEAVKEVIVPKQDGFVMVFECWNCKNRIEKHYGKLEPVNSNSVGNCDKCGKQNSFEIVHRINDR